MWSRLFYLVLLLGVTSQTHSQSLQTTIDNLVDEYVVNHGFMGSVLVAEKGEIVFARGYGIADVSQNTPNTPETKFLIGSVTKQFTAVLIMQLVEKSKLALDDRISKFLPYLPPEIGDKITVEMLLGHSSGLVFPEGIEGYYHLTDVDSYIKQAVNVGLRFEPGEGYGYSNVGYAILGRIIENVTGQSYEQVLQQQILTPLGMSNTGRNKIGLTLHNRAYSYTGQAHDYVTWSDAQSFDPGVVFFGAGFLYSTVEDLFKFSRALYTNKLLSEKFMNLHLKMRAEKTLPPIPGITQELVSDILGKCGSGFVGEICIREDTATGDRQTLYWHDGTMQFFKGYNFYSLEADRHVIILSNRGFLCEGDEIALKILRMMGNQPYSQIHIKHRLTQYIEEEIAMHAGIPATIAEYYRLKGDTANFIVPGQDWWIWAGRYVAEEIGDLDNALLILQTAVSEFPESWEGYNTLAETYLLRGDTAMALQNCRRSLELNPENETAGKLLEQLASE